MSDENAAALSEFWNSDLPMSQVRENNTPPNGWYDHTILALEPKADDNGLVYIEAKVASHASATNGARPFERAWRLYVGTHKDPSASLPETKLSSNGLSTIKGWARVCDVPSNDQKTAALCQALVGKQFTSRLETTKSKKDGKEYLNFGRNPVKLGVVPAKLDGDGSNGASAAAAPVAASAAPAGTTFGGE